MCLDLFSEGTPCGWILVSDHLVSSFWVVAYGRVKQKGKWPKIGYQHLHIRRVCELSCFDRFNETAEYHFDW